MKRIKILAIVLGVVWALLLVAFVVLSIKLSSAQREARTAPALQFEIARTFEEQSRGLSGRADIPHQYGMLFVFPEPQLVSFWMKDMLVPIDVLWLSDDGTVLGIEDSVSPDSFPATYKPPVPVRLVLEMRAGEARLLGITKGSRIELPADWQK